jgi:cardiolipin synthase
MSFDFGTLRWSHFSLLELIWILAISLYILLQNRTPVATVAWILALSLMPGLGLIVYVFFGPRRLARKRVRRALARSQIQSRDGSRRIRANRAATARGADEGNPGLLLAQLAVKAGEPPPWRCESVTLYFSGHETYDAMIEAIERAEHHIHLEYYIFEEGVVATRLREALIRKARAGVEVRLLVDGLGSRTLSDDFLAPLIAAGGLVAVFNPMAFIRFRPMLMNFRTHRKIMSCDGRVGFTGGMNIQDGHDETLSGVFAWRDTHVRLVGDAVAALELVFLEDWTFATGSAPAGEAYVHAPISDGEYLVQVVASGPDYNAQFAIYKQYFAAIAAATERVYLTTPYFVPDEALLMALTTAAQRDVDVRIMVPSSSDHAVLDAAARSYFPTLIEAGVKIFGYGPNVLHAKTLVVDHHYAAIGTANADNRSFKLNFEVTAAVFDPRIADALATRFQRDLVHCVEVKRGDIRRTAFHSRVFEAFARLFSPIL